MVIYETLVHGAVESKSLEIVPFMIDHALDTVIYYINHPHPEHGSTPLHMACSLRNKENLKLLLKIEEADVSFKHRDGKTALQLFLQSEFAPEPEYNENLVFIMKLFVNKGADIFSADDDGNTLLHLATRENDLDMVDYLLDQGANADIVSNSDETPLHYAMFWDNKKYLKVVQLLLENSADANDSKSVEDEDSYAFSSGSGAES